jgi:oxalate decarboxylase/phosphoglucose isomerase-like protein (cupin superfamily)
MSRTTLLAVALALIAQALVVNAASPFLTAQQTRRLFTAEDFVYDFEEPEEEIVGGGGRIRPASIAEFPALLNQGVAYTLFEIQPCGINTPHSHPRATELIYIINGSNFTTAHVEENGGGLIINPGLRAGMSTFFPQGLIHYQQNFGCDTVAFISALNSEDPGVVQIANQLFLAPDEALAATFAIPVDQVQTLRAGIPGGPAAGQAECLQRCGLPPLPANVQGAGL